ncbi:GNAT family N-acetyltransferase [Nafulsella turpanensis]|uniref:GNAT family N-acetyltransferase n=1 Tax=Nafulsella turpanensis TaxID=1265690 RepID=UPI00034DFA56|nr:GNAT family protein [Nafulsella turpanensis]
MPTEAKTEPIRIGTERLLLSPLQIADSQALLAYRSNPAVGGFLTWKPKNLEEVEEYIRTANSITPNTPETWYQLGIRLKDSGLLIGDMGVHFFGPQNQQTELGYAIALEHQRKGYASEAIKAVIDFLFGIYRKHRITASADPGNKASIQLLQKLGMRQEAHHIKSFWIDGEWTDDIVFAILREEWAQKNA